MTVGRFAQPLLLTGVLFAAAAFATEPARDPVAPFIGEFVGQAVADPSGLLTPGDIDVTVRRTEHGFLVDWHSAVVEHGSPERLNHEVRFEPSRTPKVYRAHQGPNVFGRARSPDPIDGRPYFWARFADDTLFVYVLQIVADGSVDFRVYERHLTGDQMQLSFTRLRDGRAVEQTSGELVRKAP